MRRSFLLRIRAYRGPQPPRLPRHPHPADLDLGPVAQWFHAVSDATRIGILQYLAQRERAAGELQRLLFVPHSRLSFHLKVLTEAGLIARRRDGRWRFYSLQADPLQLMIEFTRRVLPGAHAGTCPFPSCQDAPWT